MNLYKRFKLLIESSAPALDKNSIHTQVGNTAPTYLNASAKEQGNNPIKHKKILAYGAGFTTTIEAIKKGSDAEKNGHTVHDFEPNPERRAYPPTFTKESELHHDYHEVYCGNVHNVVRPDVARHITKHILGSLREGGVAYIGTRSPADVNSAKEKEDVHGIPGAYLIGKKKTYQEGYSYSKLKDHIESVAKEHGHEVEVTRENKFCATGAKVLLKKKA